MIATVAVGLLLGGPSSCVQSTSDETVTTPVVSLCTECGLSFDAALAKNFPNQLHVDYRSYFTAGSAMAKGTLYARFCKDAACVEELTQQVVAEDVLLSTGLPQTFSIGTAPIGESYLQLGLFTQYAKDRQGAAFKAFSVVQTAAESIDANNAIVGDPTTNPSASTQKITVSEGGNQSLGIVRLGHIVFDIPTSKVAEEPARRVWIPTGAPGVRARIRIVPEGSEQPERTLDPPRLEGEPFPGDLCGIIPTANALYAIGVGLNGAYVFEYDPTTQAQRHEHAAFLPHPDCAPTALQCSPTVPKPNLAVASFPRPCRGVAVEANGRRRLYLTRDGDDGSDATADRLVGFDVTELAAGVAPIVESGGKIATSMPMRAITVNENALYLAAAAWKQTDKRTRVYRYDLPAFDAPAEDRPVTEVATAGSGAPDCGGSNRQPPALIAARHAGSPRLFVGNENSISVFELNGTLVGEIATTDYGKMITDFALAPDGATLYAVPACKAEVFGMLSSSTQRQKADRHRVVILDLTQDANGDKLPDLLHTDRDFDGDGKPDGGIDCEFLHLKREVLRWCESCFGVLPPTHIRLPRIRVGQKYLYLRGNAGDTTYGASGLGQLGDMAVFDLATGQGLLFRSYVPWLHGPSGRWGMMLDATSMPATGGLAIP